MRKTIFVVTVSLAFACGGQTQPAATPVPGENPCAGNPCGQENPCASNPCAGSPGAGEANADFADWSSWTKKTTARFQSKSHQKAWVDVYTDDAASGPFDAKAGPYPEGARVIKAQYAEQEGGSVQSFTVMKKMPAGYNPDAGDWYYGVLDGDGVVKMEGKLGPCIGCHDSASDSDYVFGDTE